MVVCVWHHRNHIVHEGQHGDPMELVAFAADYLKRFIEARYHFATPRPPETAAHWSPPLGSTIKVNVDASILKSSNAAGIGVVARNSSGCVLAWRQSKLEYIVCPEIAETIANQFGVEMARDFGFQDIIIESDCLNDISACSSSATCLTSGGHIVEDIKNKVPLFNSVSFLLVLRTAGTMAHDPAKQVDSD